MGLPDNFALLSVILTTGALATGARRRRDIFAPLSVILTTRALATGGTGLGHLRATLCHPDDGSASDGRNGPQTAARTRRRFRSPNSRVARAPLEMPA